MKKFLRTNKNLLIWLGVILVVVGTSILTKYGQKQYFVEISYSEYVELMNSDENAMILLEDEGDFYDVDDYLGNYAKKNKTVVNYLSLKNLTEEQRKELYADEKLKDLESMIVLKDEEVSVINANKELWKTTKELIDKKVIKNTLMEIELEDYLEIIKEKGTNFMFIGSATCGHCTNFKPVVNSVAADSSVRFYYIDLTKLEQEDFNTLYATNTYFSENEWGTPLNFLYKDGKHIDTLSGYVEAAELKSFLTKNGVE